MQKLMCKGKNVGTNDADTLEKVSLQNESSCPGCKHCSGLFTATKYSMWIPDGLTWRMHLCPWHDLQTGIKNGSKVLLIGSSRADVEAVKPKEVTKEMAWDALSSIKEEPICKQTQHAKVWLAWCHTCTNAHGICMMHTSAVALQGIPPTKLPCKAAVVNNNHSQCMNTLQMWCSTLVPCCARTFCILQVLAKGRPDDGIPGIKDRQVHAPWPGESWQHPDS